jgi:hypothetical protein
MPNTLAPIPLETEITDREGRITVFFRERWEQLIGGFQVTPLVAQLEFTGQQAAIALTSAYLALAAGLYEVGYYARKTAADGVNSSLQFTWSWVDHGVALSEADAALVLDTTAAQQSRTKLLYADGQTDLSFAVAYASNTPGAMAFELYVMVRKLV